MLSLHTSTIILPIVMVAPMTLTSGYVNTGGYPSSREWKQAQSRILSAKAQANRELLCQLEDETHSLTENCAEDNLPPVSIDCIVRATVFLHFLNDVIEGETVLWSPFEVSTAVDGGVEFYRFMENGQTSLTFRPNSTQIDVQTKHKGQNASRLLLSPQEALKVARDVLRAA